MPIPNRIPVERLVEAKGWRGRLYAVEVWPLGLRLLVSSRDQLPPAADVIHLFDVVGPDDLQRHFVHEGAEVLGAHRSEWWFTVARADSVAGIEVNYSGAKIYPPPDQPT
jgi:hypothetical protein